MLPWVDHVFFDIKIMDDAKHMDAVGISNRNVLENAIKLAEAGIPATVRTPLIPRYTATVENIDAIAAFVSGLKNVDSYELLNFNPLGEESIRP